MTFFRWKLFAKIVIAILPFGNIINILKQQKTCNKQSPVFIFLVSGTQSSAPLFVKRAYVYVLFPCLPQVPFQRGTNSS